MKNDTKKNTSQSKQYTHISEWIEKNNNVELYSEIQKHKKLINNMALKYSTYNSELYKSLYLEGILGLLLAMTKYDKNKNVHLNTYAFYWIKSKMTTYIAKNNTNNILSIESNTVNNTNLALGDIISDKYSTTNTLIKEDMTQTLKLLLNQLPYKQYFVILNRYLTEPRKTFTEISAILGNSKQYIQKLELNALNTLKKLIKHNNITL